MTDTPALSRRGFLRATGAAAGAAALAACASETTNTPPAAPLSGTPVPTFAEPSKKLSGELKILLWSHFVPSHDTWFDAFVQDWAGKVGIKATVDHINNAEIPGRIAAEIQANQGHDLIQYIAPLPQFEPSVIDLKDLTDEANNRYGKQIELCRKSSFNPKTGKFYAYSPGWVPDPGDYRKSLWSAVGMPNGPTTYDDLLKGGTEIKSSKGVAMGIGMSQEIDSNMACRAIMWSYGASIQDANERVTLNTDATVEAVDFMAKLFKQTMTDEVFGWNAASNNQGLIAGKLSYILNSISAWRTAQDANPDVADDVFFTPALKGPAGAIAAQHVLYNWIVPKFAANADAAKEFLLHYTANFESATYNSKLYDFAAWNKLTPRRDAWLAEDPYSQANKDKLEFLKDAEPWSVNIGHPGPASAAEGEVFATFVIPNMFAKAARGQLSARAAVTEAETQVKAIFEKWRGQGLVGGS
jgi:Bacterial extracellular solute-binding protein